MQATYTVAVIDDHKEISAASILSVLKGIHPHATIVVKEA